MYGNVSNLLSNYSIEIARSKWGDALEIAYLLFRHYMKDKRYKYVTHFLYFDRTPWSDFKFMVYYGVPQNGVNRNSGGE